MTEDKNTQEFPPGTLIWGKVKGYPWWPARVSASSSVI